MSVPKGFSPPLPLANGEKADKWAYTEFKVVKLSYMWTITNFSCYSLPLWSPTFFADEYDKIKWRLSIDEYQNNISVYLSMFLCDKSNCGVKYKFSILNDKREETNIRSQVKAENFYPSKAHGYKDFIWKDILFGSSNELLPGDELTLFCEIEFVVDTVNTSGDSKSVPFNVPECKLTDNLANLIENEKFSDVTLIASGHKFPAHKAILAVRSDVFATMIENAKDNNLIDIVDVDHRVLKEILHFIYTGKVSNLKKMPGDLLAAANKFSLNKLKAMCEERLCRNISIKTAAEILLLAELHDAPQLKEETVDFIKAHSTKVMETQAWKDVITTCSRLADEILLKSQANSEGKPPAKRTKNE